MAMKLSFINFPIPNYVNVIPKSKLTCRCKNILLQWQQSHQKVCISGQGWRGFHSSFWYCCSVLRTGRVTAEMASKSKLHADICITLLLVTHHSELLLQGSRPQLCTKKCISSVLKRKSNGKLQYFAQL